MVISVFPDYGQAIDRYRSTRSERLERQAQDAQQAAYNRMLAGVPEDQRPMYEVLGPEQGVAMMLQGRQAEEEQEAQRRRAANEYGGSVATRLRTMQGQDGFDPDAFIQQAYEYGRENYGLQMPREQFDQRVQNPMAGEMPEPRGQFETVTVDGVQMQRGPDGRYVAMPGGRSPMDNLAGAITALATGQAAQQSEGFIPNEAPRELAENRFGPGARAQWQRDSQGNWDLTEVGERPVDVAREGEDFTSEMDLRQERISELRQNREFAADAETRARIDQDIQEEIHDLEVAQRRQRLTGLEAEFGRAADAEVRSRIDQDMEEERHELEMVQLQQRIDQAGSEAERARLTAEQERLDTQRERTLDEEQSLSRRMSSMRQFRPIARNLEGALDTIFENPNAIGGAMFSSQIASTLNAGSPAGRINDFLQPVNAEAAFGRLRTMRENSPTGGALGQVSNIELDLLKAAEGAMNIRTSPDIVASNAIDFYDRSFYSAHGEPDKVAAAVERGDIPMNIYRAYLQAEAQHRETIGGYRQRYQDTFGSAMRSPGMPTPSQSGGGGSPIDIGAVDADGNRIPR